MSLPMMTYDNRTTVIEENVHARNLLTIADIPIKELKGGDNGQGLLVFPDDFSKYGDKIGDESLFSMKGDSLTTSNIMGFIGVGDTMLKIRSRFDEGREDYFMHYMLEKVLSINLFNLNHSTSQEEIFDFLPFLFPYYLKKAMAQGLYKEYRTFERNDANMRGILDASRHIRLNYPASGKIAFKSREHTADNALTQLIRHTIEVIKAKEFGSSILSCDEDTKTYVSQITLATATYSKSDCQKVIHKNLRLKVHPYYSEYTPLAKLCMQILRGEEIKYGYDDDKVHGVVFDGAWLWEEYLNTFIAKTCKLKHPHNKTGEKSLWLFEGRKGKRFPDFIGEDIIIDAKYKGYAGKSVCDVQRDDLHQVISYMYISKASTGAFVFPSKEDTVHADSATLNGYGGDLHLIGLPISKASNYSDFISEMEQNEKKLTQAILATANRVEVLRAILSADAADTMGRADDCP